LSFCFLSIRCKSFEAALKKFILDENKKYGGENIKYDDENKKYIVGNNWEKLSVGTF